MVTLIYPSRKKEQDKIVYFVGKKYIKKENKKGSGFNRIQNDIEFIKQLAK